MKKLPDARGQHERFFGGKICSSRDERQETKMTYQEGMGGRRGWEKSQLVVKFHFRRFAQLTFLFLSSAGCKILTNFQL